MATTVAVPALQLPRVGSTRLAGVGGVVFLANAGLLVLQLVAGRLLAPFVGSSLETWTAIIGAFLAGIALGNAVGGRLADRLPSRRLLSGVLAVGGLAALWTVAFPEVLAATGWQRAVPLGARIPLLAAVLCFPPGFVLSLLTPLAIKLGLPDVRHAGRVAGVIFALSTLGCLVGNYVTGFYLIPTLTVNGIVFATAGLLFATAGLALMVVGSGPAPESGTGAGTLPSPERNGHVSPRHPVTPSPRPSGTEPRLTMPAAYTVVFLASFAGMSLELTGARLLAQVLGVSLYTWTGLIGVMLAGTAAGNWLGGILADRAARSPDPAAGPNRLALCLTLASLALGLVVVLFFGAISEVAQNDPRLSHILYKGWGLQWRVLVWTGCLFFLPMFLLGTVSPQVIRLAVPDVAHAGRVAGRVYAWSTAGAIAGTFATGFVLVSTIGMYRTVLLAAALPIAAAVRAARVWDRPAVLYTLSIVAGGVLAGAVLVRQTNTGITRETNYYTILITEDIFGFRRLTLDTLLHSTVDPYDPTFLAYVHEHAQLEFLRAAAVNHPAEQRVLVIGGGGYTYPRCARTVVPTSKVDVVEIDRGVTEVAYADLALDPRLGIVSYHMDGRQFVAEKAPPGHYHLITLDAVNDLTVPGHLVTKEFNDTVKAALTPDGVYLLTVIDHLEDGKLWRAAVHTLRQTFPHVELVTTGEYDPAERAVYVIYAANAPLDLDKLREAKRTGRDGRSAVAGAGVVEAAAAFLFTRQLPAGEHERLLAKEKPVVLTDQFAPVDYMMAEVFRRR